MTERWFVALLLVLLALSASVSGFGSASASTEPDRTIDLVAGFNFITWTDRDPYPIAEFAGSPVVRVFRFDNISKSWLASDGAGHDLLPEQHLLPSISYLIESQARHQLHLGQPTPETDDDVIELAGGGLSVVSASEALSPAEFAQRVDHPQRAEVLALWTFEASTQSWRGWSPFTPEAANTLTEIGAYEPVFVRTAAIHTEPPPEPLRFVSYSPNDNSPLEELVVLRYDRHKLSVAAEIAHAIGRTEVFWMIDGEGVDHHGTISEAVALKPGAHDNGLLYALDDAQQVAVASLPRIVKLPKFELPGMIYGTGNAAFADVAYAIPPSESHLTSHFTGGNWDTITKSLDLIVAAGFTHFRLQMPWESLEIEKGHFINLDTYGRLVEEITSRGLKLIVGWYWFPAWATGVSPQRYFAEAITDPQDFADLNLHMGQRWSSVRFWQMLNEPNLQLTRSAMDPVKVAREIKAGALGAYYANPNIIVLAPGLVIMQHDYASVLDGTARETLPFLEELYRNGLAEWTDGVAYHPYGCPERTEEGLGGGWVQSITEITEGMQRLIREYDDPDAFLFATEMGVPTVNRTYGYATGGGLEARSYQEQAECIVDVFRYLESIGVNGVFQFSPTDIRDTTLPGDNSGLLTYDLQPKDSYRAVKDYLTGRRIGTETE